ncbi:MAG: hypothetical protein MN733_33800 [Nitrososphaera sp.]|nr:hypothetical protein [Nitrososphaera sp.]
MKPKRDRKHLVAARGRARNNRGVGYKRRDIGYVEAGTGTNPRRHAVQYLCEYRDDRNHLREASGVTGQRALIPHAEGRRASDGLH